MQDGHSKPRGSDKKKSVAASENKKSLETPQNDDLLCFECVVSSQGGRTNHSPLLAHRKGERGEVGVCVISSSYLHFVKKKQVRNAGHGDGNVVGMRFGSAIETSVAFRLTVEEVEVPRLFTGDQKRRINERHITRSSSSWQKTHDTRHTHAQNSSNAQQRVHRAQRKEDKTKTKRQKDKMTTAMAKLNRPTYRRFKDEVGKVHRIDLFQCHPRTLDCVGLKVISLGVERIGVERFCK